MPTQFPKAKGASSTLIVSPINSPKTPKILFHIRKICQLTNWTIDFWHFGSSPNTANICEINSKVRKLLFLDRQSALRVVPRQRSHWNEWRGCVLLLVWMRPNWLLRSLTVVNVNVGYYWKCRWMDGRTTWSSIPATMTTPVPREMTTNKRSE